MTLREELTALNWSLRCRFMRTYNYRQDLAAAPNSNHPKELIAFLDGELFALKEHLETIEKIISQI